MVLYLPVPPCSVEAGYEQDSTNDSQKREIRNHGGDLDGNSLDLKARFDNLKNQVISEMSFKITLVISSISDYKILFLRR